LSLHPRHVVKLVHFIRDPVNILQSSYRYHLSGHENFPIALALGDNGYLTSGLAGYQYCSRNMSINEARASAAMFRAATAMLAKARGAVAAEGGNMTAGYRHSILLRHLRLSQGLTLEAAWGWCEASNMVDLVVAACTRDTSSHVLLLDIELVQALPAKSMATLAEFVDAPTHPSFPYGIARGSSHQENRGSSKQEVEEGYNEDYRIIKSFRAGTMPEHMSNTSSTLAADIQGALRTLGPVQQAYRTLLAKVTTAVASSGQCSGSGGFPPSGIEWRHRNKTIYT